MIKERQNEGVRKRKRVAVDIYALVLLKRAKTFSHFFPFSPTLVRSAKMHPQNCRLQ